MSNFTDGAPRTQGEWLDLGLPVFPCRSDGTPGSTGWQNATNFKDFLVSKNDKDNVLGLRLDNHVDLDIDNPIMQKFLGEIICGAKFGRKSNPISHLLFQGETKYESVKVPKAFDKYFKHFPHKLVLLDIRSGSGHFTYVPGGFRPHKKDSGAEKLQWLGFTGFMKYDSRINAKMKEICLKTALSVMFSYGGSRNEYINSIAGILSRHTDWTEEKISSFCFDIAFKSGHEKPTEFSNVGTNAKNDKTKTYGIPKLAKLLEVTPLDILELFSWVGVKDPGSSFSALRVYLTDPKYWQLKYKDNWITVMDSSMLLSYTKISILILENCYEVAPVISPKEWKEIIRNLLSKVEKIDAPLEASYYGMVMNYICEWILRENRQTLGDSYRNLALSTSGVIRVEGHYYFKLKDLMNQLKRSTYTTEIRKLTHHLRDSLGAEDSKVSVNGKQIRCWKVAVENVDNKEFNNTTKYKYIPKPFKEPEPY